MQNNERKKENKRKKSNGNGRRRRKLTKKKGEANEERNKSGEYLKGMKISVVQKLDVGMYRK